MVYLYFLIAHLLGDFFFQNNRMAAEKSKIGKAFFKHCFIYTASYALFTIWFGNITDIVFSVAIIGVSHLLIDATKTILLATYERKHPFKVFIVDQTLHIGILFLVTYNLPVINTLGTWLLALRPPELSLEIIGNILILIALYLINLTPASILLKKLFQSLKTQRNTASKPEETNNLGHVIGILERIILLTLGLWGHFATLGLVLTAKSLARVPQMGKDPNFAEDYLIGTLTSTFIALISIFIGKTLLLPWF